MKKIIIFSTLPQRYDVDKLNAVLELNPEAPAMAQALDEERAAGNVRGPMHGIPVLLKDNNEFLTNLGADAPTAFLEAIIAFNNEDAANRILMNKDTWKHRKTQRKRPMSLPNKHNPTTALPRTVSMP